MIILGKENQLHSLQHRPSSITASASLLHLYNLQFNMMRTAVLRCARQASIRASRPVSQSILRPTLALPSKVGRVAAIPSIRFYSAHAGLAKDEVEGRILDLLKNFDKVRGSPQSPC